MGIPQQRFDIKAHKLWGQCDVAEGVYISDMVRVRGKLHCVKVCEGAFIADFVVMLAEAQLHIGERAKLNYQTTILAHAPVVVCAHAKIGVGVKVLGGASLKRGWTVAPVEIGTGAVISAGAVIMPGAKIEADGFVGPNEVVYGC